MSIRTFVRGIPVMLLLAGADALGAPEPATVIVGNYVNQILDLSFKDRRYIIDFWVWFRWAPVGELADYKPLESFELINGRGDSRPASLRRESAT